MTFLSLMTNGQKAKKTELKEELEKNFMYPGKDGSCCASAADI